MLNGLLLWQSFIPQGLAEQAEVFARTSYPSTGAGRDIDPLIASAAALLCVPGVGLARLEALDRRARELPLLTAEWVLLHGLIAAAQGHLGTARQLLGSLELFDSGAVSSFHRQLALEWLLGDARSRSDDRRVAALEKGAVDYAARTLLQGWIAKALPRPTRRVPSATARWRAPQSTLAIAVASHATAVEEPDPSAEVIERLGLAWRNALRDPATTAWLGERARVAGEAFEQARGELWSTLRQDFVELLRRVPSAWDDLLETSELITEALELLRQEWLHELESAIQRLEPRVEGERALSLLDEWLEWLAIRERYTRLATRSSASDRRLIFQAVHVTLCNWGVWLANDRQQRPMAHVLFRWLHAEAVAVGEDASAELNRKNAAATA